MKKTILFALIFSSLLSCTNDEENLSSNLDASLNKTVDVQNVINFTYDGKSYSSTYTFSKDSSLVLENQTANNVYNELQNNNNLATFINKDQSIQFYNNYDDLKEDLNFGQNSSSSNSLTARSSMINDGEIIFYQNNRDNGGNIITYPVYDDGISDSNVGVSYGFNDQTSAFYIKVGTYNKYTVTLFRDPNYGGRSISFAVPLERYEGDLKSYRMGPGTNWNDQMSSFKVTIN